MKQQNFYSEKRRSMRCLGGRYSPKGFSLVELLVCLIIVSLLMAILYVAFAPARARGGATRCVSNLRQIGMALQMYRQDYGGGDPPKIVTAEALGLPPGPFPPGYYLEPYVKTGRGEGSIFWCDVGDGHAPNINIFGDTNYMCPFMLDEALSVPIPHFSELVRRHGDEVVLMADPFHTRNGKRPEHNGWDAKIPVITLRLDGHVRQDQLSPNQLNQL